MKTFKNNSVNKNQAKLPFDDLIDAPAIKFYGQIDLSLDGNMIGKRHEETSQIKVFNINL